jgi:hypothetical protein
MKKTITLLLAMLPVLATGAGLPEGFNGMRWGAPVSSLDGAQKIAETAQFQCYRHGDGATVLGEAPMANLRFCFSNDRFYFVQMDYVGKASHDKLMAHGKSVWGEPKPAQRFTDAYVWGGPDEGVYIELEYSKIDDRGTLALVYLPIYRETQEEAKRTRSKPRPGSGF